MSVRKGIQVIVAAIGLLISWSASAGNNPEYRQTLFGKDGQLSANAQLYTFDINYEAYKNTAGAIEKTWSVKNAVRLMVDEESPWYISSDFTATIKLNITTVNAAGTTTNLPQKTLTINYKKGEGQVSGAITSFEFKDAVKVTVTIAEAITKNVSWDVTKNLKLVNEIISLRDWGFNCSTAITGIVTDSLFADEWKVKWNVPANFQTEYDLEWAWVDESVVSEYMVNGVINTDKVFEANATRITTSSNFYRIPLLYEDYGRIYVRVRMAQVKVEGQRVEGNWYYLNDGGLGYLSRAEGQGHEISLNWQATTTFAEEGKRKTVIQYYDGTLRGRQTVTKDNVNRTTVVAETMYDYQGRPLIQVLPAPTLNTIIQFTKNFNQFDDTRNAKTVYDKLDPGQAACNKLTAKMLNTAAGSAAQYYSANNPLVNDGFNKFIPDAQGYPYVETRYTNDGTGRVDAQGGVGPLFQVNSGRDTKYYYESADQDDLDALFGTDVGYASHYTKTWVRDANGQYSVSYTSMTGKTIATALAGEPPANLSALPSYAAATKSVTRQLIDPETNNLHGNSILSSKSLMVAKAGNYQFNYSLSPEKLKLWLCNGTQFCFDCLYELNISIVPDCSDKVVTNNTTPVTNFANPLVKRNFTLGQYLQSCASNNSPLLDTSFSVWLPEGAYTIVKELKLSTAARDWYRENVFLANDTCKRRIDFINEQYLLALNQQNCYTTCAQCNTKLGTQEQFIARFRTESGLPEAQVNAMMPQLIAAYNDARANCDRLCEQASGETTDELTSIRDMMLQDMTPPSGQYARVDDEEHHYSGRPFNIFNPLVQQPICVPQLRPYQSPVVINSGTVSCAPGYQNNYGVVTLTAAAATALLPEAFADQFEESYAWNLLPYHPEYKKYKYAEANLKGAYRFGDRLQNTETWSQAVGRGFILTTTSSPGAAADYLMQKDSFFIKTGFAHAMYTKMRNAITSNYVAANEACGSPEMGMWKLARFTVFCQKQMRENSNNPDGYCGEIAALSECLNAQTDLPPSASGHCEADMNRVWLNFRALYISLRNKLISQYLTDNAGAIDYSIFTAASGNNYQERFVRFTDTAPYVIENMGNIYDLFTHSNEPGVFSHAMQAEADSICRSNSGNWITRLRQCPAVDALATADPIAWAANDSTWLSKYLVKICTPGVDFLGHPFGAASLPDAAAAIEITETPNGASLSGVYVRNFPDLIRWYFAHRNILLSAACFPELVDYPKAYNVAPATVAVPVISVPEPCVCERINYFKVKWMNAGSPGTFSSYLLNTQGTSISQDTLNILLNMCNTGYASTNPNCNFLPGPIKLPAIFQCRGTANPDSSKACITCADYNDIKAAFYAERGVPAPYAEPQDETELQWNRAFAAFANYRTGFSKTWYEYVAFGTICAGDTSLSCNNLFALVAAWQATNPPTTGEACRTSFTQYMNYHTGRNLGFDQWMGEFIKQCGTRPPVCAELVTCSKLKSLANSYYNLYGPQIWRNASCQQLFTQFVNDSLQSSYTYADITTLYSTLCGYDCALSVCSFPNSHLLTWIFNKYKSTVYNPTWTVEDCQANFVNYFNNQLGFTANPYSPGDIEGMYSQAGSACAPAFNELCVPPYSCTQLQLIVTLYQNQTSGGPGAPLSCEADFTSFFNGQMNTSYSYTTIVALYQSICGQAPDVCEQTTGPSCRAMILFTQTWTCNSGGDACSCFVAAFNTEFHTNFGSYAELQEYYYTHCGFALHNCLVEEPVFNCEMLTHALEDFNRQYPGGGAALGADCEEFFRAWFNNLFAVSLSFEDIKNLYAVQCENRLQVCQNLCMEYTGFMNDYNSRYATLKVPLAVRQQLFAQLFNTRFGYVGEKGENAPRTLTEIISLLSGCVQLPSHLLTETQYFSLTDPSLLRDFKRVYLLRYPAGMPADCTTDFTSWINWAMDTTVSYCQLSVLYNALVGAGEGTICGSGCSSEEEEKGLMEATGSLVSFPPMLCGLHVEIFTPPAVDTSKCKDPWLVAVRDAEIKWELYLDSLRRSFDVAWMNKCANAKNLESFTVSYQRAEHHYTLYYYDQAGQLVRTVPPEGVDDRRADAAFLTSVKTARNSNAATPVRPAHTLATDYRYNTLGQVVQQLSPDGGLSKFWYDALGRLVVSQNAQQAIDGKYSYTLYDALGRISEVGQKPQATVMTQTISRDAASLNSWITGTNNREQLTRTVYDVPYPNTEINYLLTQRNLRNRVSYTQVWNSSSQAYANGATYYTYDIHGNVDRLLQDYGNSAGGANIMNLAGHRFKVMAYDYDLISGKVNQVCYQPGYNNPVNGAWAINADQFYHRYVYDAENRLTDVYTSQDSLLWERDAQYQYYKHGPLARTVLGQQKVQGVDYAYNLQGWIKGVNSTAVGDGSYDMGGDGKLGGANSLVARDAYGYSLNYYTATYNGNAVNDYKAINGSAAPFTVVNNSNSATGKPLFNGNISAIVMNLPKLGQALVYQYGYDQLNRLLAVDVYTGISNTANSFTPAATNDYKERLTYSANGNILNYLRNGSGAAVNLNNYSYSYQPGTNKLNSITNSVNGQTKSYSYDRIGNTIMDGMQSATNIVWNVYGKVQSCTNAQGQQVGYTYSASGSRISKTVAGVTDWYVRDGSGNMMATYTKNSTINANALTVTEWYKYGNSLVSISTRQVNVEQPATGDISVLQRGLDGYILSDHLSNTRAVVSDRKLQHSSNGTTVDYYEADIKSATYYSSYGAISKSYNQQPLVAFNSQRKSGEIGADAQTALYWEYNGDVGVRWNMDPVVKMSESPYACFSNNPIGRTDIDGDKDTAHANRIKIYQSQLATSKERLEKLGAAIKHYQEGIKEMQDWMNFAVAFDLGMCWNIFYWGSKLGADQVAGNDINYMARELAKSITELETLCHEYNAELANYDRAAKSIKEEFSGAKHFETGSGIVLDNLNPQSSKAGAVMLGATHLNKATAEGKFVVYEIVVDGETFKFGIADANRIRKSGEFAGYPERLAQQLSKIRKYASEVELSYFIRATLQTVKADVIKIETATILAHAREFGIPLGNVAHIKKYASEFGLGRLSARALTALSKFIKF